MSEMIAENQHGFIEKRSTTTKLFRVTQFIANAINSHSQVDVMSDNFSKEFDKLEYEILFALTSIRSRLIVDYSVFKPSRLLPRFDFWTNIL